MSEKNNRIKIQRTYFIVRSYDLWRDIHGLTCLSNKQRELFCDIFHSSSIPQECSNSRNLCSIVYECWNDITVNRNRVVIFCGSDFWPAYVSETSLLFYSDRKIFYPFHQRRVCLRAASFLLISSQYITTNYIVFLLSIKTKTTLDFGICRTLWRPRVVVMKEGSY